MSIELVSIFFFLAMVIIFLTGLPVAFGLGSVAMIFGLIVLGPSSLALASINAFGQLTAFVLIALPLFVFMGTLIERSGLGKTLYEAMYKWLGGVNGGLAIGTIIICTIMAAMVGMVGPATIVMGLIGLPSMLSHGYEKKLALGSIMGGGALGAIIPPSIGMILYSSISGLSIGQMFIGGILPGLMLSGLMMAYIAIRCFLQPHLAPSLPPGERATWREKFASLWSVILPIILVLAVLGSIFFGICTPTESAALGAVGAIIVVFIYGRLSWRVLRESASECIKLFGLAIWIVIGATCFSQVYQAIGAMEFIREAVDTTGLGPWGVLFVIQLSIFLMGMIMEDYAIILVAGAVYAPVIEFLGFDPLWFSILFLLNMQLAVLTPPYGFSLFYMKAIAPRDITMWDLYKAAFPFIVIKATGLIIVMLFPEIVLWLPRMMK